MIGIGRFPTASPSIFPNSCQIVTHATRLSLLLPIVQPRVCVVRDLFDRRNYAFAVMRDNASSTSSGPDLCARSDNTRRHIRAPGRPVNNPNI